jgi:hypothetical protein
MPESYPSKRQKTTFLPNLDMHVEHDVTDGLRPAVCRTDARKILAVTVAAAYTMALIGTDICGGEFGRESSIGDHDLYKRQHLLRVG